MFTKEELNLIHKFLSETTWKIGSSANMKIAEDIIKKIQDKFVKDKKEIETHK